MSKLEDKHQEEIDNIKAAHKSHVLQLKSRIATQKLAAVQSQHSRDAERSQATISNTILKFANSELQKKVDATGQQQVTIAQNLLKTTMGQTAEITNLKRSLKVAQEANMTIDRTSKPQSPESKSEEEKLNIRCAELQSLKEEYEQSLETLQEQIKELTKANIRSGREYGKLKYMHENTVLDIKLCNDAIAQVQKQRERRAERDGLRKRKAGGNDRSLSRKKRMR